MQPETKKHHFVPRSLLRYFSVGAAGDFIYVIDKRSGKSFRTSLMNAGSQNAFNTLEFESHVWNFEPIFGDVDGRLATLLRQIHQDQNAAMLSPDDRLGWADMVAVQLVRTPLARMTITQSATDLVAAIEEGFGTSVDLPIPTDNDARASTVQMFQERDDFRTALEGKDFVIFRAVGSTRFLISDHPVVRQSSVPYGDSGLNSPGVAIYLPLGRDLMLGLLCKSIQFKLNLQPIESLSIPPEAAQRLVALREGLRTGQPVGLGDNVVARFNHLLVAGSSRFLYGPEDSFDEVRRTLDRHPGLREVKSLTKIGRMGSGPGPSCLMPEGQQLVLFGQQSHYMVEVSDWSNDLQPFEAHVVDVATLRHALDDAPFVEMRLFVDKQQLLMKRNVRVDVLDPGPPIRIQVRHSDPAMDALDAAIRKSSP